MSVFSKYLQVYNAKKFKESVTGASAANVYLTLGKTTPWTNENSPDSPDTSVLTYYEVWNNMIGGKKITGNDIRHVVPRFNWTNNTTYIAYTDSVDSKVLKTNTSNFFVVTDEWNVYKCISNNNSKPSTTKPTTLQTTVVQTEDGYVWKYMYSITDEEKLRFVTDDYIPVKTLTVNDGSLQWQVQNTAVSGGIHNITITNGGANYTANDIVVSIVGNGQDARAVAVRNTISQTVESITITNPGINYTYANVTLTSATGNGAIARAIISPKGGHGSDPLTELGGSNLMLNMRIKSSENGVISVANDYRQISLIENPLTYDGTRLIANTAVNQLLQLTLNGTSVDYVNNETVYQGTSLASATFSATVVEWDSANNILKVSNTRGTPTSELINGVTSTASRFLSSVTNPDMKRYTGNLLYTNNILPIQRSSDQVEDFKIILKF